MELTKKEKLRLLKMRETIRKLTLRILEKAHDPQNSEETKKNMINILSQLNEITSSSFSMDKSFQTFQTWAVAWTDYIFQSISIATMDDKTVDALLWRSIVPDLTTFAKVVNQMSFAFTENGVKLTLPKLSPKKMIAGKEKVHQKDFEKDNDLVSQMSVPDKVLERLPKEVQKTLEGVKLCYQNGQADFCFMGLRKALSTAIHIRFKREGKEEELYDANQEPYSLTKWIELAKQNGFLSATLAKQLAKEVKIFGDVSSHDYRVDFQDEEVPSVFKLLRLALDRMYYEKENAQNEIVIKSVKKSLSAPPPAALGREFDLMRFKTNLTALNEVSDSATRYELLEKIRDQTTDLPYDGISDEVKQAVFNLLLILETEISNEKMRRLCLDILRVINGRREGKINERIKLIFLPWIEKNYQELTVDEKQFAIDLLQRLNQYGSEFIKKIMFDSINNWSFEEFDKLHREIEFNRLDVQDIQEMKIYLWKILDEARKNKLEERKKRIEKLLKLSIFA